MHKRPTLGKLVPHLLINYYGVTVANGMIGIVSSETN